MVENGTPPPPFHHAALLYSMATLVPYHEKLQTIVLFMLHPILPYLKSLIYWASIIMTIRGSLLVELTNIITTHKIPRSKYPKHPHPAIFMFPTPTGSPFLIRYMVLNTVQLNQSFVDYLAALRKNFMGFIDSMHRIGCNTILLLLLASTASCNTFQSKSIYCSSTFYPKSPMDNSRGIPTGNFLCKPQSPSNHMSWSFNLDKLVPDAATTPYADEHQQIKERSPSDDDDDYDSDDDRESSPQPTTTPLCIMTTVISNINSLILVIDDDIDEEAYSFSNKPAEFGTDNCAIHRICSILDMFISMCTVDKI